MQFMVHPQVFEKLPGVCFGMVVAKGVNNQDSLKEIEDLLDQEIEKVRERFKETKVKEHPLILPYREAFSRLGFNPNKFLSSIEALATRIAKGGDFPKINNIVNLVNAVSLKYLLPMGAHDIDQYREDVEVRFSREGDTFIPFGQREAENVEPGELVYADGSLVKTRRWIWRQSEIGKITEATQNIFCPLDGFRGINHEAVVAARDELAALLKDLFHCEVKTGFIDAANRSMDF